MTKEFDIFNQLPDEYYLQIQINHQTINLSCTNESIEELIIGFLYNTRLISSLSEITEIKINNNEVSVILSSTIYKSDLEIIRTSSMGVDLGNYSSELPKFEINRKFSVSHIIHCIEIINSCATKYNQTGGMHASLLSDGKNIISFIEDIGRHNTLDKICGTCLINNINSNDTLLITTGRISTDMVGKAARMGVTLIGSFSTTTQKALKLASDLQITLIVYINRSNITILTHKDRIIWK